ncbi:hypothetical protein JB92DRAFT_791246 [Gautieria morchelliformis]|nr:hypothetical protein JB92DRAFT_791246 [Gautieria morchelliformis]
MPIKHSLRITLSFLSSHWTWYGWTQSGGIGSGTRGAGGCRAEGSVLGRAVQVEGRESVLGHAVQVDAEHGRISCVHVPAVVHIWQYRKNRFYSAIYR